MPNLVAVFGQLSQFASVTLLYAYVCFYVVSVNVIDRVTVAVGEIDVPNTNDLFCADAHGSYCYSEHTQNLTPHNLPQDQNTKKHEICVLIV